MIDRKKIIKERQSSLVDNSLPVDFSKIRIGTKMLEDPILEDLGNYKKMDSRFKDKKSILEIIRSNDYSQMREISNLFFKTSGIYSRLCKYMALMYRYDWMVTPYINEDGIKEKDNKTILADFYKILLYLDNSYLKSLFGEIGLKVIKNGCYYGYLVNNEKAITIQELPVNYCRSRFKIKNLPVIEFNMRYFDIAFKDSAQRARMLNLFPEEFKKGYRLYREGELPPQFSGDTIG